MASSPTVIKQLCNKYLFYDITEQFSICLPNRLWYVGVHVGMFIVAAHQKIEEETSRLSIVKTIF